jgi:aspartate-semialdehyde dehydrogenase
MKVAVIGATGLVGKTMLNVLHERNFPVDIILPVASSKSVGNEVMFNGKNCRIISIDDALKAGPDIALFSAGASVSLEWSPFFADIGTTVIDNSSAWRMDKTKKLIVPEVNADVLTPDDKIIANPNCSTIQLVVALNPLHNAYKIRRIVVSTYQSVTGGGQKGLTQMMDERSSKTGIKAYPHSIDMNVIPHIDIFLENDYTKEEMKMVNETRKIIGDDNIRLTATTVRVPVMGGHSEAVNVEFENEFEIENIKQLLTQAKGVMVMDAPSRNFYPMPKDAEGRDEVFVGRIRRDESQPKTLNLWIVSDNLRKGAALNAVQIAEYLVEKAFI